jgi:hypothetical protein
MAYNLPWLANGGAPESIVPPSYQDGSRTTGATLTVDTGVWSVTPTSYTYQHYRDGVAIGGATNSTYVLTSSDEDKVIHCEVTAYNGASASAATAGLWTRGRSGAKSTASLDLIETVATDGRSGDRGNVWGGHQLRVVRHRNQDTRLLYVRGDVTGGTRNWRLMKKPSGSTWSEEATQNVYNESALFMEPKSNTAHVVGFLTSNGQPAIYSQGNFSSATNINNGSWPNGEGLYANIGVGKDGLTCVHKVYEHGPVRLSSDVDNCWATGTYSGGSWTWGSVQQKNIGERRTYHYIIPGAFGDRTKLIGSALRDINEIDAGIPNYAGAHDPYIFDGIYRWDATYNTTTGYAESNVQPFRTAADGARTTACTMLEQDMYSDGTKLYTMVYVSDPDSTNDGYMMQVQNSAGTELYNSQTVQLGEPQRFFKDDRGRLWVLVFGGTVCRIYSVNSSTYALTLHANLDSSVSGLSIDGYPYIVSERGGCKIVDTIYGYQCSGNGATIRYFELRLPD